MPTTAKRAGLWLLAGFSLLLISLALAWSLQGEAYLRQLLLRQIEAATDYRLVIDGDFQVALFPAARITAGDVSLFRQQQPEPLLHVDRLELKPALLSLLSGTPRIRLLLIDGLALETGRGAPMAAVPDKVLPLPRSEAIPVVQQLVLRNFRLSLPHQAATDLRLTRLTLDLADDGFHVDGETQMLAQNFKLSGRIGSLEQLFERGAPYPVDLQADNPLLSLRAAGSVAHPLQGEGLALTFTAEALELDSTLALIGLEMPPLGRFAASAQLQGSLRQAALHRLTARLEQPDKLDLEAGGDLLQLLPNPAGELSVGGFFNSRELAGWLLPSDMATVDDWRLNGRLWLEDGRIGFRELAAQGVDSAGLRLDASGAGQFGETGQAHPFASLDLQLDIDADSTAVAQPLLIETLPELGPVTGRARLTAPAGDRFSIEDYRFQVGDRKELSVSYTGRIGRIPVASDEPISELDIRVEVAAARTERIGYAFDRSLPEIGPVHYSGRYTGSEKGGLFNDIVLTAGQASGLLLRATGALETGDLSLDEPPRSLDLKVSFSAPGTAPIAQISGIGLPELGAVNGRFRLSGSLQQASLSAIDMRAGKPGGLELAAAGAIEKLQLDPALKVSGVNLRLQASSPDSREALSRLGLFSADLGQLSASGLLSDADGSLGLEKVSVGFSRPGRVTLKITGQIDDLAARDQLDARARLSAASLQEIGDSFGRDWRASGQPLLAEGQLHLAGDKLNYAGDIQVGKTMLEVNLAGSMGGGKPKLQGSVESEVIHLSDFGYPESTEDLDRERRAAVTGIREAIAEWEAASPDQPAAPLFSANPLPWELLHELDLALDFSVDQVQGTGSTLNALTARIELADGRLIMSPAVLDYSEGTLLVDLLLDANGTPGAALKISADDVAIGEAWSHVHSFVPLSGNINLHLDLNSSGRSPAELAGNLSGVAGIVSENLAVPQYTANLLAVDILGWALKKTFAGEATIKIHCSILQARARQGRFDIQQLFFDGPNMMVTGEGWVDLKDETMKVSIFPNRKKGIWAEAEPVQLTGAMTNPEIGVTVVDKKTVAVAGAAGAVAAGAVAAPMVVLPAVALTALWELVSRDSNGDEESPCLEHLKATE